MLKNKKLLVLTGSNGDIDIIKFAKANGVFVAATDYHKNSKVKSTADISFDVSTTDVDKIASLAKKLSVDGITTGTSESAMYTVLSVTEHLGLPFYATRDQLNLINNKKKFKNLISKFGVKVPVQFSESDQIEFPVIVKPVDSSGSKGISVCNSLHGLNQSIIDAKFHSRTGDVLIEKLIETGGREFFANYTIANGEFSLSCAFDNFKRIDIRGLGGDSLINFFPSRVLNMYIKSVHAKMIAAFKSIGLMNGVISIQAMFDGKDFYVYEAGYRLGGSQSYIFNKAVNGISYLEMMVRHSLTGKMLENVEDLANDNPYYDKFCCQRNIAVNEGQIKRVVGKNFLNSNPNVLNITQNLFPGCNVSGSGTSKRLALRIHLIANTIEQLSNSLEEINSRVDIIDIDNKSMIMDRPNLYDFI